MMINLVKTQPKAQFYESFSPKEINNIIQGLSENREIPFKYFYKEKMAKVWDNSVKNNYLSSNSTTQSDIFLLENSFNFIEQQQEQFDLINLIDIGPGNSYPVKQLISQLDEKGWLNRYIGIDISQDILNLSKKNIKNWFPNVDYKGYILDFEENDFREIIKENNIHKKGLKIINILVYLGETIGNHVKPLNVFKNFRNSLDKEDILMLTFSLKLPNDNPEFNCKNHISYNAYEYFLELLNIKAEDCEIIGGFDHDTGRYFTKILFHQDYVLDFKIEEKKRQVFLKKGETIQIYRYRKYPLNEKLEIEGFFQEMEEANLIVNGCNLDISKLRALAICQPNK
ncbi:MAG: L-histidine N(alpha)-methyltransferase [Crocosphaera sp.]|uniref:L-histidine N(alpha)-methyltransferase n=1 Tax=Crocosphaera sp. TaxID=2729996 RepID=UPI00258A6E0B|nr:L-histidine N(alpha)-methyltransferase [Crocosphaera sp.]MCH2247152.1 L-histidine N(alpha)-methyltransferase [Crocosphaera sp.]